MVASLPVAATDTHPAVTTHHAVTIAAPLPAEATAADPVTTAVDPVSTAADTVATPAATAQDPVDMAALLVTSAAARVTPPVADAALHIWPLATTVGDTAVTTNSRTTVSVAMTEGMKCHSRNESVSRPFAILKLF